MSDIELVVGRIGKPHGLRGEVTVDVRTDEPERRFARGSTLRAEPPPGSASSLRQVTVSSSRWHQSVLLLRFEEVPDRAAAESARGIVLRASIPADESPDDPDDVSVRDKQLRRGSILEVRVHPEDLGKVIGRSGRTASAFRTVVSALAGRGGARIDFVDVDRRR